MVHGKSMVSVFEQKRGVFVTKIEKIFHKNLTARKDLL